MSTGDVQKAKEMARAVVARIMPEDTEPGRPSRATALALAWIEEVNAQWDRRAASMDPAEVAWAKKAADSLSIAGGQDSRLITCSPGLEPVYDVVNGKKAVCVQAMMGNVMPLWVHYYRVAHDAAQIAKELEAEKKP